MPRHTAIRLSVIDSSQNTYLKKGESTPCFSQHLAVSSYWLIINNKEYGLWQNHNRQPHQ